MRGLTTVLCIVAATELATPVAAQTFVPPTWTAVASTGSVDESSLGMYQFNTAGTVAIKSGVASGVLQMRYNVANIGTAGPAPSGECVQLRASLRDTGAGARVLIKLQRMNLNYPYTLTTVGVIDSDVQAGPPSANYVVTSSCVNVDAQYGFDPSQWAFFVDAQLIKTASAANPGLMWVEICNPQGACAP